MGCSDAALPDQPQGVVFLEEELAAIVYSDGSGGILLFYFAASTHNELHGLFPRCASQLAILTGERMLQTIIACVSLPPMHPFWAEPTVIDSIVNSPSHSDNFAFR